MNPVSAVGDTQLYTLVQSAYICAVWLSIEQHEKKRWLNTRIINHNLVTAVRSSSFIVLHLNPEVEHIVIFVPTAYPTVIINNIVVASLQYMMYLLSEAPS